MTKRPACAHEQRFGRVHGAVETLRDLGDGEAVEVAQGEGRAVMGSELGEDLVGASTVEACVPRIIRGEGFVGDRQVTDEEDVDVDGAGAPVDLAGAAELSFDELALQTRMKLLTRHTYISSIMEMGLFWLGQRMERSFLTLRHQTVIAARRSRIVTAITLLSPIAQRAASLLSQTRLVGFSTSTTIQVIT